MNINQQSKGNQLFNTLEGALRGKINKARILFISSFIFSLCKVKTVNFTKLALAMESNANSKSALRKIQRFIANYELDSDIIVRLIFNMLPQKPCYQLIIDRTNWRFGNTNINILMLAVVHDGVAYPLMFSMLEKKGNSNTDERINLINRYIRLFGQDTIESLLADREFVGSKWIQFLNDNHIRYYVRIRNNFYVTIPRNNRKIKAFWLFENLKLRECKHFDRIFHLDDQACYLAGSKVKTKDGKIEFQIIISFDKPQEAIAMYKNRWQIETAFRAMKTAGFNIEDTHLADIERIEKLLYLVMIAFAWSYNVGEYVHRNIKEIAIKKHGRKEKSIFRYGLDIISEFLYKAKNQHNINIFDFLSCT